MRIVLVSLLLLALPCWALADEGAVKAEAAVAASAGGDWDAGCLEVPNGCTIDCVGIELSCCKECCPDPCFEGWNATLRVEFFGADGALLASGDVVDKWCDPCPDCKKRGATFGQLTNPIDPCAIATAKLSIVEGPEAGVNVKCLTLWVRDPQGRLGVCEKWYKAWKCCPPCCQVLGGGTAWNFTSNGCCPTKCGGCDKCGVAKCGTKCGDKCGKCNTGCKSKCGGCNKCAKPKCGCKDKCNPCGKCNKCETKCGCKSKCGDKCGSKCGDKCGSKCKSKCGGCNKCAKPKCGCKDKCNPCGKCNKCETKCGCKAKCGPKCGGCDKCAKPKCGCGTKCGGKCGKSKCSCGKCGGKSKCGCGKC